MAQNPGMLLDLAWVDGIATVNLPSVVRRVNSLNDSRCLVAQWQAAWLCRAVTCIDLTTLNGDDTRTNVQRLCKKAVKPIRQDIIEAMGVKDLGITCGAICVYPARILDAYQTIKSLNAIDCVPIAAVASGFPSGQYPLKTRLEEIRMAIEYGASEIDIVINRQLALMNNWVELYEEVKAMKQCCGPNVQMKAILAVGELGSLTRVYKASLVCMMAGADFIKTSTGKESINATLPVGLVMCRAIRDYHKKTSFKVGFKPAGGIKTANEACNWLILIKEELGDDWLDKKLFRIGASALLSNIERQLYHYVTGSHASAKEFATS